MKVLSNTHTRLAKKTNYGTAVRREGNATSLFIVLDMFTGDKNVRLVNLETGCLVKVPDDEELIIMENAYVEIENPQGYI
jgi:hypothetical protein